MVTTVSVVIVLGVIIATIARAVLEDEQPATTEPRRGRDDQPSPPETVEVAAEDLTPEGFADEEPILVPEDDLRIDGRAAVPVAPSDDNRSIWRRLRSMALLAMLIVVLGGVAAAVAAVVIVGGASLIDQALG